MAKKEPTTADKTTATTAQDHAATPVPDAASDRGTPTAATPEVVSGSHEVKRTVAGSTWVALIVGAIILILLLVFILQNMESVKLQMFVWQWNFPIGVGMLIAAVGGALVIASVGVVRIVQLRRQVKQ